MAKQIIGVGISANDKKGDSLRTAFTKVNANFTELYNTLGGGLDLLNVSSHIIPAVNNTYDLGSPSKQWRHGYFATGSLYIGDLKISNDTGTLVVQQVTDAGLETEEVIPDTPGVVTTARLINGLNEVALDANGVINHNGTFTKTTNSNLLSGVATQVVWTSTEQFISGVKLTIQVECGEGSGSWEVQVCEAVIAAKGFNSSTEPVMTVYGVTHTSVAPLMTFTVDRNIVNNLIEIVGTRTGTANPNGNASLRIYSVETGTND